MVVGLPDPWRWCVGLLAGLAIVSAGCRAFRTQEMSVEQMAASRQQLLQGIDAQQRGQWDEAETRYAAAVAASPRDERARAGYAEALWQRGAQEAALSQMAEAVRLSGDDPDRLVQLGAMLKARGELHRALTLADRAIAGNRQLAAAWALRGEALQAQGAHAEALAAYHRALSLQNHFPQVQLAVAQIYSEGRKPQRALATLQALASRYPAGEAPLDVVVREGLAYRDLGRYPEAAKALAQAAERGAGTPDVWCELANLRLLTGDVASARLASSAALAADPHHPRALALQAQLASHGGLAAAATGGVGRY
jgi:tetratricopeptide (TPR) repeat protein